MPIGRVVLCRITKAEAGGTRFNCSTRKSLAVYGVHQVNRSELKTNSQITVIILALSADGVAFGQLKGSYHKIKVKSVPENAVVDSLCQVELAKVSKDKLVGEFQRFVEAADFEEAE